MMTSKCINVVIHCRVSFIFKADYLPMHNASEDEHLGFFYVVAIVNSDKMSTGVLISLWDLDFNFFG
jgi:hypothetical protein